MIGLPHRAMVCRGDRPAGILALGLGGAGVAAQIGYPLTAGAARDLVTTGIVLLLAAACVAHAAATRGVRWAAGLVLITTGGGLAAEFVGTTTGFPFGAYTYTTDGALGPEIGSVPLLIGPAWTFGAYSAWCAAQAVTGRRRGAVTVATAAWGLASWDLYLDPQMVADRRWVWTDSAPALPGVPTVPLSNHAGWLLVALLLCSALCQLDRVTDAARPGKDGPVLVLFCWTWLGSAVAHAVFLDLPASAVYGLVGMGLLGVPLLSRAAGSAGPAHREPTAARERARPSRASTSRVERDRFRV